jgi:NAD(P)-dependent dehydrogenase (short-subunit alcohol dehydrogenase family)
MDGGAAVSLLDGKVAVVAGVTAGLGRDIALALAREGADVCLLGRQDATMATVADEVRQRGRRSMAYPCDITDSGSCERSIAATNRELGKVDIVVNNTFHAGDFRRLVDADLDDWRATMETNLFGALALVKAAVPVMRMHADGRFIMVNTQPTHPTKPGYGAYSASKAAMAQAVRSLARELGEYGIRVNAIQPGFVVTDSVREFLTESARDRGITEQDAYDELARETALGYLPPTTEIAGTVVYLASALSRPVTGETIAVNAGQFL